MKKIYFGRLAALAMIACAVGTVQPAVAQDAKQFVTVPVPPEGKAQVVFFRAGGFVGSAISCAPRENGVKVSSLPPARYFIELVDPGQHMYTVQTEAKDTIRLNLKPGDTTYVKCHIEPGFFAGHPKLEVAQEAEFTSKEWKPVDDARKGENVLTQAEIKSAAVAKTEAPATDPAMPAPAVATAAPVVPTLASTAQTTASPTVPVASADGTPQAGH